MPSVEEHQQNNLTTAHPFLTDPTPGYDSANARLASPIVSLGEVQIDGLRQRVLWDGSVIHLPPREMSVMLALVAEPGAPVASSDLASRIWPGSRMVTAYDVRRIIHRLRSSLRRSKAPLTIHNVRGMGYFLDIHAPRRDV
jgi:DNA-binding response OmpR family regulator